MLDYKNKYLKYKQKYFNLKKMIGGGTDATYIINDNQLTVTFTKDGIVQEINYTILETSIGKGTSGTVYKITKNDNKDNKDKKEYIFKILAPIVKDPSPVVKDPSPVVKDPSPVVKYPLQKEGTDSQMLKDILDDDMIPLFQGIDPTDFLISTYNGNNLFQEFQEFQKFKDNQNRNKYAIISTQLLKLLHTINSNDIFHNDIKLENITIKQDRVYLIDFGLLTKSTSNIGSLISMSYNGVIALLKKFKYIYYHDIFDKLNFLKNTDIVGFFYCCIDLLFLLNKSMYSSLNILYELGIKNFNENDLYILFNFFYFILPTPKRNIDILDINLYYFDKLLPSKYKATHIFGNFLDEHTNLFRFMTYIYNKIDYHLKNKLHRIWYKKFLKCMSACFLPEFNYDDFIPLFNKIVNEFSSLSDYHPFFQFWPS